jgi:hypothetical protein
MTVLQKTQSMEKAGYVVAGHSHIFAMGAPRHYDGRPPPTVMSFQQSYTASLYCVWQQPKRSKSMRM